MITFLILFLPLIFAIYFYIKRDYKIIPPAFIGFMAAILFCGFKLIFKYSHRIVYYSFMDNFLFLLLKQTLVPCIVICALYFLFSKDDLEIRVNSIFPLLISFYMVFVPFTELSENTRLYTWFALFDKPVLIGTMLIQFSILAKFFLSALNQKNIAKMILWALLAVIATCIPCVLETAFILNFNIVGLILLSILDVAVFASIKLTN